MAIKGSPQDIHVNPPPARPRPVKVRPSINGAQSAARSPLVHSVTLRGETALQLLFSDEPATAINDGDVILLRTDMRGPTLTACLERLRRALEERGLGRCLIMAVDATTDLAVLSEDKMREYGWTRLTAGEAEGERT